MNRHRTPRQEIAVCALRGAARIAVVVTAIVAAWALSGPVAAAEQSSLRLTVKDRESGDPIAKAVARLQRKGAEATEVASDESGLIDLGALDEGTYSLTVNATGYGPYRTTVKAPAAKTAVDVLLKRLRTLKVTVGAGGLKLPGNAITIAVVQAAGPGEPHKCQAKVSAKRLANCTGLLDGPACLMALYHDCVVYSARITVDGDGQEKIELDPGGVRVKGKMHTIKEMPVSAVVFVHADSHNPGGTARVAKSSFTTVLLPGKYDAYAKCHQGCYSLGQVDVSGNASSAAGGNPATMDLTLDLAKAPTAQSELAIFGLEELRTAPPPGAVAAVAAGGGADSRKAAGGGAGAGSDDAVIAGLIPTATAMTQEDFDIVFRTRRDLPALDAKKRSLTLSILELRPTAEPTADALDEFELLANENETLAATKFRAEISPPAPRMGRLWRGPYVAPGPRTLIRADRITACTCDVEVDVAKGTVSYEVPNLYRGKFDYVAKRGDGGWQITELSMPARKIHLVRNADGDWTAK